MTVFCVGGFTGDRLGEVCGKREFDVGGSAVWNRMIGTADVGEAAGNE